MKSAEDKVIINWALAKVGQMYVVYLKNGGAADLNVGSKSVNLVVKWYNPRTGGALQNGSVKKIKGQACKISGKRLLIKPMIGL